MREIERVRDIDQDFSTEVFGARQSQCKKGEFSLRRIENEFGVRCRVMKRGESSTGLVFLFDEGQTPFIAGGA